MAFDTSRFYAQLDAHYAQHDNAATEAFLLEQKEQAYRAGAPAPVNDSCPSCVPAIEPNMAYVAVCNELACFYRGLSRWQDSLDAFGCARAELEALYRQDMPEYATVLLNEAGTYRYMGRAQEALERFARAAKLLEGEKHPRSEVLAGLYNNTGLAYLDLQQPQQALACFQKALELATQHFEMTVELGTTWNNLAVAYDRLGEREKAGEAIQNAVEILAQPDDGANPHYPAALNTRGVYAYRAGNYEAALADFETALEKTKYVYGENVEYAAGCENCARACDKLGRTEEAAAWQAKSDALQKQLQQP